MRLLTLLFTAAYRETNPKYCERRSRLERADVGEAVGGRTGRSAGGRACGAASRASRARSLFVTGTENWSSRPEIRWLMTAAVPATGLARLPGAGHGLMYQDPQGLADVVMDFLDQ